MPVVRIHNFSVSLDGYGAGPGQDVDNPIGANGGRLHEWIFPTRSFRHMVGEEGGESGVDDDFIALGDEGIGATIMGRNMFGPIRGPWLDESWTGWWGPRPPYGHPVFVLTQHPRPPIHMEGGTTFHFVAHGIESALEQAMSAAGGADVRIGGGVSTVRQYLRAGLVDEMHLALVPILLGRGEQLFDGLPEAADFECVGHTATERVIHARFVRRDH